MGGLLFGPDTPALPVFELKLGLGRQKTPIYLGHGLERWGLRPYVDGGTERLTPPLSVEDVRSGREARSHRPNEPDDRAQHRHTKGRVIGY